MRDDDHRPPFVGRQISKGNRNEDNVAFLGIVPILIVPRIIPECCTTDCSIHQVSQGFLWLVFLDHKDYQPRTQRERHMQFNPSWLAYLDFIFDDWLQCADCFAHDTYPFFVTFCRKILSRERASNNYESRVEEMSTAWVLLGIRTGRVAPNKELSCYPIIWFCPTQTLWQF